MPIRLIVLLVVVLSSALVHSTLAQSLPLPSKLAPTGDCAIDNIYYGAVAPAGQYSRVLVFVHGLGGLASDWWDTPNKRLPKNDMYELAYNAGYRTAFVEHTIKLDNPDNCTAARIPGNSVRDDATTLAKQIDAIREYYQVDKVDLIGHSKGGVVIQAAIVYNDMSTKVRDVFTIDSPHQGSLLADYAVYTGAYSDAAVLSLRHPVMADFRQEVDASPLNKAVRYYYGVGNICTEHDPGQCSDGASYLLSRPEPWGGENDGTVTAAEAVLTTPGAQLLFKQPWTHYEASLGHNSFPYIQQVLLSEQKFVYLPLVLTTSEAQEQRGNLPW